MNHDCDTMFLHQTQFFHYSTCSVHTSKYQIRIEKKPTYLDFLYALKFISYVFGLYSHLSIQKFTQDVRLIEFFSLFK